MEVSIIIPTCNRVDMLKSCLDAIEILCIRINTDKLEVIVTDDSKDEITSKFINEYYKWVKIVEGPKKGPASNRNNGARHAKGEWLIFIDDDCIPHSSWLTSYLKIIYSVDEGAILEGCTIADRPKKRFDEEAPINLTGDNLWSCNFAIKKRAFNEISGFDESFPHAAMEDIDFYDRAKKITGKALFIKEAIVTHPWRLIKPTQYLNIHLKSHIIYLKKHRLKNTLQYRIKRMKIFLHFSISDLFELAEYNMRGWKFYISKCLLNFCLIFA